jgi:hypothetical protein
MPETALSRPAQSGGRYTSWSGATDLRRRPGKGRLSPPVAPGALLQAAPLTRDAADGKPAFIADPPDFAPRGRRDS